MNLEPDYTSYRGQFSNLYNSLNYSKGISAFFLKKSHELLERQFRNSHFDNVLEVGCGTGIHISYVTHSFNEYVMTDNDKNILSKCRLSKNDLRPIAKCQQDASSLTFKDNSFDRLIATHVLEHLERPHLVLREWHRVVRPGGIISIVLPCDPGIAWRIGRYSMVRRKFIKQNFDYDYWMAREHINPINNLVNIIRYYFENYDEKWYPFRLPSIDINLFYVCNIKVEKNIL